MPAARALRGQWHADDQAIHNAMSHIGSDGSVLSQRVERAGYFWWSTIGENVAANWPSGAAVMAAWMNSPGHRANILSPTFTHFGAGVGGGERDDLLDRGLRAGRRLLIEEAIRERLHRGAARPQATRTRGR